MMRPGRVTRRWFGGVAVASIIAGDVWFWRRRNRLLQRAHACRARASVLNGPTDQEAAIRGHYIELARQYEHAASRPWLSVTRDALPPPVRDSP